MGSYRSNPGWPRQEPCTEPSLQPQNSNALYLFVFHFPRGLLFKKWGRVVFRLFITVSAAPARTGRAHRCILFHLKAEAVWWVLCLIPKRQINNFHGVSKLPNQAHLFSLPLGSKAAPSSVGRWLWEESACFCLPCEPPLALAFWRPPFTGKSLYIKFCSPWLTHGSSLSSDLRDRDFLGTASWHLPTSTSSDCPQPSLSSKQSCIALLIFLEKLQMKFLLLMYGWAPVAFQIDLSSLVLENHYKMGFLDIWQTYSTEKRSVILRFRKHMRKFFESFFCFHICWVHGKMPIYTEKWWHLILRVG